MDEPPAENSAEKSPKHFQTRGARLQTQIRREPLCALRVIFFVLLWTLALANVVVVAREFESSLPFVIGLGPRRRIGIEDSRRQALPVIIAPCIILIILIPLAVGLPLFAIASFLARYIVEALWTGMVAVLTLAGAAALSPQPTSPLLPRSLQYDLSVILGLSYIIVVFLSAYNILLLCRISFLIGKGTPNPIHAPVSSLIYPQDSNESQDAQPKPDNQTQEATPEEMVRVDQRLENGSIKTLSSGWDDDDEEKGKKTAKGESRFAKARSLLTSPLKQSSSNS